MKFTNAVLVSALSIIVSSCASNTSFTHSLDLEVVKQPESKWIIHRLMASSDEEVTRISGRLTANSVYGLPQGHVDIAAYKPTGELIAETTADYTPVHLTRKTKRKGGIRFSSEISEGLPANTIVKVAFHPEVFQQKTKPLHDETIAR